MVSPMREDVRWQHLYETAIVEPDPATLVEKIRLASAAMQQRRKDLAQTHDAGSVEEQRALADALKNLEALERLELRSRFAAGNRSREHAMGGQAL